MHYFRKRKSSHSRTAKRREIARYARKNSRRPRPSRLIILIWRRFISAWWVRSFVRSFAFVRSYLRNIAFKSANSLGLSLKLITSWRTLSTEPTSTFASFFLALDRALFQPARNPLRHHRDYLEATVAHVGRVRFRPEAHFPFSGILPISDCFARYMPCTNKSKKEVPLSGRTFDSGECDSLQETYRRMVVRLGVFRERRANEKAKASSSPLSIVFSRLVDCDWRRGHRGILIAGCQTRTCD